MAYRREGVIDHVLSAIGSLLFSIPSFLLAALIIAFFGVEWNIIPFTQMRGSLSPGVHAGWSSGSSAMCSTTDSAITVYVLSTIGSWMLTMKSSTISTLDEDYVTVARARGLPNRRIVGVCGPKRRFACVYATLDLRRLHYRKLRGD